MPLSVPGSDRLVTPWPINSAQRYPPFKHLASPTAQHLSVSSLSTTPECFLNFLISTSQWLLKLSMARVGMRRLLALMRCPGVLLRGTRLP